MLDESPVTVTVEETCIDEELMVEVVHGNVVAEVLAASVVTVLDDVAKGVTFGFRF